MELEKFKKAEEIKKELDNFLELRSFCCNDSTFLRLAKLETCNEWEEAKIPPSIEKAALDYIKDVVDSKIKELDQQFKQL